MYSDISEDEIDYYEMILVGEDDYGEDMDEKISEVATVDLDHKLNLLLADCPNALDKFSYQELKDMEAEIEREIELYVGANILDMQNETFHEALINHIFCVIFSEWHSAGLFEENDADDIREWIEDLVEIYFNVGVIPPRQSDIQRALDDQYDIGDPNILKTKLMRLNSSPQPSQRSMEWYIQRYNMLTASNAVKMFGTEAAKNSLIYEKCRPFDVFMEEQQNIAAMNNGNMPLNDTLAMNWGVKYEPVTVAVYEFLFQEKITQYGCIQHPDYSFIGASPDGIVEKTGRMVEIKNIFNREICGVPKDAYWVQMQWQMETCDLDECDFVETRFKEFSTADEFYEKYAKMESGEEDPKIMGVMIFLKPRGRNMVVSGNESGEEVRGKYLLMPLSVNICREDIQAWFESVKIEYPQHFIFQTYYWILDEWSCILVQRNRVWFEAALPIVKETWNTILQERETGNYMSRAPQKKKNVVVKKDSENNRTMQGMPASANISVVKMSRCETPTDFTDNSVSTNYSSEETRRVVYMM